MKIDPNVLSTMREMLADFDVPCSVIPEKDWSEHLPFIKVTEEDFETAIKLIKKHIKNAGYREEVLEDLEDKKERTYPPYYDFFWVVVFK